MRKKAQKTTVVSFTISDFPILAREWRARFRNDKTFVLFALLSIGAAWAMIRRLNVETGIPLSSTVKGNVALASLSQDLLFHLVWTQILLICLLAPLLSAPLIARERESGVNDDLLLTPLSPWRVVLEKWAAGGMFLLLVLMALWPLDLVALLLGNVPPVDLWGIGLLGLSCLAWGDALGLAFSAHGRRAAGALRSSLGVALVWLIGSFICGVVAGESALIPGGPGAPFYMVWFGRTNPILCALDVLHPSPFMPSKWPYCGGFLLGSACLLLWWATHGVRKPLPELPLLAPKRGQRGGVSGVLSRLEMPIVGRFAPRNPVLGREVRGKFRLRQPPMPVLVTEIVLVLAVGVAYLYLAREAVTTHSSREIIFWGVTWTGFFVSLLAASSLGGAALTRERENGTWEAMQLSLLSPLQIVGGKLVASLATTLVLSLPVWPLLFVCVEWGGAWSAIGSTNLVQPFQFISAFLVWVSSLWLQTVLGLLISTRARKAGGATALTAGLSILWMVGSLFLITMGSANDGTVAFLTVTNPVVALASVTEPSSPDLWRAMGWPFALFAFVLGGLLLGLTNSEVAFQIKGSRAVE